MRILVTGGAGFIGSCLVRQLIAETRYEVLNVDTLTYAGNLANLGPARDDPRHRFVRQTIVDGQAMAALIADFDPDAVIHLAAETHVDRSIDSPAEFVMTNVAGTYALLEASLRHWEKLAPARRENFRFVHVSTDEVYGSLRPGEYFSETSAYKPNSPYSATKASSDMLVRAWFETFGLPTVITNCTNNYGPYQYPEKLIPLALLNALDGKSIPVYGDGRQERDWLFVEDHTRALRLVAEQGKPGEVYCIGGNCDRPNIELVNALCAILDQRQPAGKPHADLIGYVTDRPGHDRRYAMDIAKIGAELGWRPQVSLEEGLARTVDWYMANRDWCALVAADARARRGVRTPAAEPAAGPREAVAAS